MIILVAFFLICPFVSYCGDTKPTPITSAKKYLDYLKTKPDFPKFSPPETVVMIYSSSLLEKILKDHAYEQGASCFSELYVLDGEKVAVCYVPGHGAPALINKMEQLIAFGVKKIHFSRICRCVNKKFGRWWLGGLFESFE